MNDKKSKPNVPFALCYAEAENKIFDIVNESAKVNKIPFYLLEGILTNILHQVREQAKAERDSAARLYEKQLAEYEEATKEAEKEEEACKKQ